MITVKELIERLQSVDENLIVIIQKDSEGNGYSPLSSIDDECVYEADSTWSGEVGYAKLTLELEQQGYDENDLRPDGIPALILCPVN